MPTQIDIKDAAKFFGGLNEALVASARVGLLKAGERGLQKLVTQIIPSRSPQPVDRGVYRAGWKTERVDKDTVAIFNPEPHAVFIERGVRAGNVKIGAAMIRALSEWATRKGMASDEKEAIGVAWAIARSMQSRGIFNKRSGSGLRIMQELVDEYLDDILREEVSREMQRAADRAR